MDLIGSHAAPLHPDDDNVCIDDAITPGAQRETAANAFFNGGADGKPLCDGMNQLLGNKGGAASDGICDKIMAGDFGAAMTKNPKLFKTVDGASGGATLTAAMVEIARVMAQVAVQTAEATPGANASYLAKAQAAMATATAALGAGDSAEATKSYKRALDYALKAVGDGTSDDKSDGKSGK